MESLLAGAWSALWLGILTSINPCPLATNIAAISYIGRGVESPRRVLVSGLLYTLGRSVTYVALGALLVAGLLSAPGLSHALSTYMNQILGPVLIVVGMFLLELVQMTGSGTGVSERLQKRVDTWGMGGAVLLGVVFALSFCPLSALLFFGSLLALAVKHSSEVLLPLLYGIGTALPVLVFAVVIALGAGSLGRAYDKITAFSLWARRITGIVFIAVGMYLTLVYIYEVF